MSGKTKKKFRFSLKLAGVLIGIIAGAILIALVVAYFFEASREITEKGLRFGELDFGYRIAFILKKYGLSMLNGAGRSLLMALVGTAGGSIIGFVCGIIQTTPANNPVSKALLGVVKLILNIYVEVFRGTPMMVQAVFIFYGAKMLFGLNMEAFTAGLVVITINTGAYMAESVRGGIISVDNGQFEGAQSIGMNHFQTMLYVVLPQALRNIMPQISNNFIINIKDSCVLAVISVSELFFESKSAAGVYYSYFEVYTITMVMYLVMTVFFSRTLRFVEKLMDGPDNYELAANDLLVATSGPLSAPKVQKGKGDIRDGR